MGSDPIFATMPQSPRRATLVACFATVYLVWGSTYLVASIGVHVLPPFLFGGIRFTCAGILLGLVALALGRRFELDGTEWRHMFLVALGNVVIANGATNVAMQHVASNQTAILNASAALWIALLATRGRRAHALDRRTLIGLVIGFAGATLIIWPRGSLKTSHFRHAAFDPRCRVQLVGVDGVHPQRALQARCPVVHCHPDVVGWADADHAGFRNR
jgi:drug/metabolite transporter (DMT)-like permease